MFMSYMDQWRRSAYKIWSISAMFQVFGRGPLQYRRVIALCRELIQICPNTPWDWIQPPELV